MEKSENIFEGREVKEIDLCRKAIELYLRGKLEFTKQEDTDELKEYREYEVAQNAESLSSQSDGLRIGAPGWSHVKLVYGIPPGEEEKHFFVVSNGMEESKFQKWQSFIGEKFEENNLNFFYFE